MSAMLAKTTSLEVAVVARDRSSSSVLESLYIFLKSGKNPIVMTTNQYSRYAGEGQGEDSGNFFFTDTVTYRNPSPLFHAPSSSVRPPRSIIIT